MEARKREALPPLHLAKAFQLSLLGEIARKNENGDEVSLLNGLPRIFYQTNNKRDEITWKLRLNKSEELREHFSRGGRKKEI